MHDLRNKAVVATLSEVHGWTALYLIENFGSRLSLVNYAANAAEFRLRLTLTAVVQGYAWSYNTFEILLLAGVMGIGG